MAIRTHLAMPPQDLLGALAGMILALNSFAVSAEPARGLGSPIVETIPLTVVVEYATIGGVQLPVQILRPDSTTAVEAGQLASNRQIGTGNTTEIGQAGQSNRAAVVAIGDYNTAVINQEGRNNTGLITLDGSGLKLGLRQDGNGNRAELGVNGGSGGSLTVQQTRDGNTLTGTVPGGRDVAVIQSGGVSADVSQAGALKGFSLIQVRTR